MKNFVLALWALVLLLLAQVVDRSLNIASSSSWRRRQRPLKRRLSEGIDTSDEGRRLEADDSDWNDSNDTNTTSTTATQTTRTETSSTDTSVTLTSSTSSSITSTSTSATKTTSTSSSVTSTSSTSSSITTTSTSATKTTSTSSSVTSTSSTSRSITGTSTSVTKTTSSSTRTTSTLSSTWSTTSTTTVWGDVLLALDYTVGVEERLQLQYFAAQLAENVTESVYLSSGRQVKFGVVLFGQEVFFSSLPSNSEELWRLLAEPELTTLYGGSPFPSSLPRYTHEALDRCQQVMLSRPSEIQVVVILTNGLSYDPLLTRRSARDLDAREVQLYSVGMDNASQRQSVRAMELEDLAVKQYDAYYVDHHPLFDVDGDNESDSADSMNGSVRRLQVSAQPVPITELAFILASDLIESFLDPPVVPPEPSQGLDAGIVVLIILLCLCCFCSSLAGIYYVWKSRQEPKRGVRVVPMQAHPVLPTPRLPPAAPRPPLDPVQRALQDAITAKDLRKLRVLLSELLLKGWPDAKYTEMVLNALNTLPRLRGQAARALEEAIEERSFQLEAIVADARFCGVDRALIQQAEALRLSSQQSAGTLR